MPPQKPAKRDMSHNNRIMHLEDVHTVTGRYFNMGILERERPHLVRVIDRVKCGDSYTG